MTFPNLIRQRTDSCHVAGDDVQTCLWFFLLCAFGCVASIVGATSAALGQESSLLHRAPPRRAAAPGPQHRQPMARQHAVATQLSAVQGSPGPAPAATGGPRQGVYQDGTPVAPMAEHARPAVPQASSLTEASWMYTPALPPRQFRMNDIVTIRVDEIAQASAEGAAENRKNSLYDAVLKDWISLSGGFLKPAEQSDGDPRVNGQLNTLYRADASIESRESLTFNIAARIVDIRPNGNLVLEAHKTIWVNDNAFETSLSGICRAEDIGPDNVLLSRDLLDPQIRKNERGRLRDGYRRGWFQRWFEEFQLF